MAPLSGDAQGLGLCETWMVQETEAFVGKEAWLVSCWEPPGDGNSL